MKVRRVVRDMKKERALILRGLFKRRQWARAKEDGQARESSTMKIPVLAVLGVTRMSALAQLRKKGPRNIFRSSSGNVFKKVRGHGTEAFLSTANLIDPKEPPRVPVPADPLRLRQLSVKEHLTSGEGVDMPDASNFASSAGLANSIAAAVVTEFRADFQKIRAEVAEIRTDVAELAIVVRDGSRGTYKQARESDALERSTAPY